MAFCWRYSDDIQGKRGEMMASKLDKTIQEYWADRAPGLKLSAQVLLKSDTAVKSRLYHYLRDVKPGKALDMGTGAGYMALELARMGYEVTAIDYTKEVIDVAEEISEEIGIKVDFKVGDIIEPDLPDGQYDLITARNTVWGLTDPYRAYASWKRLLKPGG